MKNIPWHNPDNLTPDQIGKGWRIGVVGEFLINWQFWDSREETWDTNSQSKIGFTLNKEAGSTRRTQEPLPAEYHRRFLEKETQKIWIWDGIKGKWDGENFRGYDLKNAENFVKQNLFTEITESQPTNTTMKDTQYINLPTLELSLLFIEMLKNKGYAISENLHFKPRYHTPGRVPITIQITEERASRFHSGSPDSILPRDAKSIRDGIHLNTAMEVFAFFDKPVIKCGEYTVEPKEDGVQVGCTFVSWETVEKIAELKNEYVK